MVSLHLPEDEKTEGAATEQEGIFVATPQGLPAFQSTSASTLCLNELRTNQLEKAADTAFFERRPRVRRRDVEATSPSQATHRRWILAL